MPAAAWGVAATAAAAARRHHSCSYPPGNEYSWPLPSEWCGFRVRTLSMPSHRRQSRWDTSGSRGQPYMWRSLPPCNSNRGGMGSPSRPPGPRRGTRSPPGRTPCIRTDVARPDTCRDGTNSVHPHLPCRTSRARKECNPAAMYRVWRGCTFHRGCSTREQISAGGRHATRGCGRTGERLATGFKGQTRTLLGGTCSHQAVCSDVAHYGLRSKHTHERPGAVRFRLAAYHSVGAELPSGQMLPFGHSWEHVDCRWPARSVVLPR